MPQKTPSMIEIIMEDGSRVTSTDFVAVINNEDCDAKMYYNTDAVTLGQAIQLLSFAYTDQLGMLPEEQRNDVREALSAYIESAGE